MRHRQHPLRHPVVHQVFRAALHHVRALPSCAVRLPRDEAGARYALVARAAGLHVR